MSILYFTLEQNFFKSQRIVDCIQVHSISSTMEIALFLGKLSGLNDYKFRICDLGHFDHDHDCVAVNLYTPDS